MSITDYVVFEQGGLFQTLIQATQCVATATKAPVERVAERLRVAFLWQQSQCHPSLVSTNHSGVWIASGRNDFHVAKGSLIGAVLFHNFPLHSSACNIVSKLFQAQYSAREPSWMATTEVLTCLASKIQFKNTSRLVMMTVIFGF